MYEVKEILQLFSKHWFYVNSWQDLFSRTRCPLQPKFSWYQGFFVKFWKMLGWCWHKNSSLGNPSSELFYNIEQIKIPTYCILRISTLLWSICQHTGCPLHAVSALLVPLHVVFLLPFSSEFSLSYRVAVSPCISVKMYMKNKMTKYLMLCSFLIL